MGEIIAKDALDIANLMQNFKNLLLQNYCTEFLDFAHEYFLGMCNLSLLNGCAAFIISEILAKDNLNIANLM